VPRDKAVLVASGLTSAGLVHNRSGNFGGGPGNPFGAQGNAQPDSSQVLDEESESRLAQLRATDAEIDEGLDGISKSLDNIARIAKDMNSEVKQSKPDVRF
jgi:hypothetical protein